MLFGCGFLRLGHSDVSLITLWLLCSLYSTSEPTNNTYIYIYVIYREIYIRICIYVCIYVYNHPEVDRRWVIQLYKECSMVVPKIMYNHPEVDRIWVIQGM